VDKSRNQRSKNQTSTFAEATVDKAKNQTSSAVVVSLTNNFLFNGKSNFSPYLTSAI
jgi:hypothetical protein